MRRELVERELVAQPIKSLQYMLRRLSINHPVLPQLVADGFFGERTLEAVMLFQREFLPPVTGVVDQRTWNAIYERWLVVEREQEEPRPLRGFPRGAQVVQGAQTDYLYSIQAMFRALSAVLEGIQMEEVNGIHSGATVANVRWLQRRAMLEETGIIDQATWNALTRLYELFTVAKAGKPVVERWSGGREGQSDQ